MEDIISNEFAQHRAYTLTDMGYLNDSIKGYLIEVLRKTSHFPGEIEEALGVLPHVLDTISAEDAAEIAKNWRR